MPGARRRDPPWGIGGSLGVIALFYGAQLFAALSIPAADVLPSEAVALLVVLLVPHLLAWLAVYLLVVRWHGAAFGGSLRLRRPARGMVLKALLGGALLQGVGLLLLSWLAPPPEGYVSPLKTVLQMGWWGLIFLALLAVVLAPLLEEVLFRGLLFSALRRHLAGWLSALLSTLLFTLMHSEYLLVGYWPPLLVIAVVGWLLARWREQSGLLWPCIVFHAAFNLTALLPLLWFMAGGYPLDQLPWGWNR